MWRRSAHVKYSKLNIACEVQDKIITVLRNSLSGPEAESVSAKYRTSIGDDLSHQD